MMLKHFTQEMDDLKSTLHQMVAMVDDQVTLAIEALETGNLELCRAVKEKDKKTDAYENLVQAQCENLFALFQPVAIDLRSIMTALMISNQVERCGDIAVNIAARARKTIDYHDLVLDSQVVVMAKKAQEMLKSAITAFREQDEGLARNILVQDEAVDDMNKSIFKWLVEKMQQRPEVIEPCAHLIVLTRHLERLADHATNIAEEVIFWVEAHIVAHQKL
jgi:phosphate transport system protein